MFHQAKLKKEHLMSVLGAAAIAAKALEANDEAEHAKKIQKAVRKVAEAFRLECDCPKCKARENTN